MEDRFFRADAKSIVDMLHNAQVFREGTTRDDMNGVEDLIHFLLQSRFESYVKTMALLKRVEEIKKVKND